MKDNQISNFVRNRYYTGKMLTSKDFQTEQLYMNQKRNFLNHMMYGTGVVCGLSVRKLDEISFMVESGVAMDEQGREIVVPVSLVKKISAIAGVEQLTGSRAALCLRYNEEMIHPVYSVAKEEEGKEYEYNHIQEGYELYLEDISEQDSEEEEEFLCKSVFLKQEDFKITLILPRTVKKGKKVKLVARIEKLSDRNCGLSFGAALQLASLRQEDGSQELRLEGRDIYLDKGAVMEQAFWLFAEQSQVEQTSILLEHGTGYASVADCDCKVKDDLELKVNVTDMSMERIASSEFGRDNYENRVKRAEQEKIVLAELTLLGADGTYIITEIREREAKNYINTPESLGKRLTYNSYFAEPELKQEPKQPKVAEPVEKEESEDGILMTNGFVEIPLHVGMKKGDVCYSDEILHGLGKGDVYVKVGVQCLEDDVRTNQSTKTTIYGNSDLFKEDNHMKVETAVKVYNDKGSFQIAARLTGAQKSIVLLVHWVAVKFNNEETELEEEYADKRIVPKTSAVKLAPKESHCFQVEFEHMNNSRLTYELTESESGEITQDGIYTAPDKTGVYEIHIYCTDMPEISTYVYAVVKKADAEETVSLVKNENQ